MRSTKLLVLLLIALVLVASYAKKTTEPNPTSQIELLGMWTGTDSDNMTFVMTITNSTVTSHYHDQTSSIANIISYDNEASKMILLWTDYPAESMVGKYMKVTWSGVTSTSAILQPYKEQSTLVEAANTTDTGDYPAITLTEILGEMIQVQGGTFNNGTSDVTLSSFYIDKYELTQAGYLAMMGSNPASGYGVGSNYPVYYVSWFNAIEFCNRRSKLEGLTPCYSYSTYGTNPDKWPRGWNSASKNHTNVSCNWTAYGYRLPTEAEWQFAARGGNLTNNYLYSGSSALNAVGYYWDNWGASAYSTHTVGALAPNELGIFDMSGNVWEWTWDIYANYPRGSQNNPKGANSSSYHVLRGGSWIRNATNCLVSFRNYSLAPNIYNHIGFRCVRKSP